MVNVVLLANSEFPLYPSHGNAPCTGAAIPVCGRKPEISSFYEAPEFEDVVHFQHYLVGVRPPCFCNQMKISKNRIPLSEQLDPFLKTTRHLCTRSSITPHSKCSFWYFCMSCLCFLKFSFLLCFLQLSVG